MSNRVQPVVFKWLPVDLVDGETGEARRIMAMVPLPRYDNVSKRQYHADEEYTLAPVEERSMASHNQYFAALSDGFKNLPDKIAARWPTVEHFRAWCLIETGWFLEKEFELRSPAEVKRLGTFIRTESPYARMFPNGNKLVVQVAKSQSIRAMGKAEFQKSKSDVLDLVENFIGVERGTLMREGGRNA